MSDNNLSRPKPQPPEPYYQDELDVLEAVAKLEKKYGKELLTKEQREKLSNARNLEDRGGSKLTDNGRRVIDLTVDLVRLAVNGSGEKNFEQRFGLTPSQMKQKLVDKYMEG